jgi:hypothetical protein
MEVMPLSLLSDVEKKQWTVDLYSRGKVDNSYSRQSSADLPAGLFSFFFFLF